MALFGRKNQVEPEKEVPEKAEMELESTLPKLPALDELGQLSVAKYQQYLLSLVSPLEPFGVQLLDAWGLNCCEELKALSDMPSVNCAKHLGFAVSSLDLLGARPGAPAKFALVPGPVEAVEPHKATLITAGSPIPLGADVVVPAAEGHLEDDSLFVETDLDSGSGIQLQGSDIAVGEIVLSLNQRIGARQIGLLAGLGIDKVFARPKARVVVISVDEVSARLGKSSTGYSMDANSFMLAAAARATGAQVWRVGLKSLDDAEVKMTISDQLIRSDLIVTTGGIESESSEVLRRVVPELGSCEFADLAMTPAQTHGVGLIGEEQVPIVMLPSDPVSAYIGFTLFCVPMLRKLDGIDPVIPKPIRCYAATVIRSPFGVSHFIQGIYTDQAGRRLVQPVRSDQNHLLSDLSAANCIIGLGQNVTTISAGEPVMVMPLADD